MLAKTMHLQPYWENWRSIYNEKDDSESLFPLVLVWGRHEESGNYTHLISLPRNYSLIAKSGTSSNFEIRNIAFHLLVHLVQLVARSVNIFYSIAVFMWIYHTWSISKFNIITCVLPPALQPFSYSFLFCYKITSGNVRTFDFKLHNFM